jgi:hypothetical protein
MRWVLAAIAVAAVAMGTVGWDAVGASCGTGSGSPGQTTAESFKCNGGGYALLAAWGLGALALTGVVATEFIRRLRDTGDDD